MRKTDSKVQVSHGVSFSEKAPAGMFLSQCAMCKMSILSDHLTPDHTTTYSLKASGKKDCFVIITSRAQKI